MKSISFIWDENKADENHRKHKISFEEAQTVFSDPNAWLFELFRLERRPNKRDGPNKLDSFSEK